MVKHKTQKGFTLVELVVVIALLMITAGVTVDIILTLVRSYNKTKITNEIEQVGNFAMTKIERELRVAKSVIDPGPSNTSAQTTLQFISDSNTCIRYSRLGSNGLQRQEYTGFNSSGCSGSQVAGGSGSLFTVSNDTIQITNADIFRRIGTNPDVIKIRLNFSEVSGSGGPSYTGEVNLEQTIVVRSTYN